LLAISLTFFRSMAAKPRGRRGFGSVADACVVVVDSSDATSLFVSEGSDVGATLVDS